jgi:hypothetical protein
LTEFSSSASSLSRSRFLAEHQSSMAVIACNHTLFRVIDILCFLVHEVSSHPLVVDELQFRRQDFPIDELMVLICGPL